MFTQPYTFDSELNPNKCTTYIYLRARLSDKLTLSYAVEVLDTLYDKPVVEKELLRMHKQDLLDHLRLEVDGITESVFYKDTLIDTTFRTPDPCHLTSPDSLGS